MIGMTQEFSDLQVEEIYAEIEEQLFVGGCHRETVLGHLRTKYKMTTPEAERHVEYVRQRWKAIIEKEELPLRHYQLERMAHELYRNAVGTVDWQHVIPKTLGLLRDGKTEEAIRLLEHLQTEPKPDLRNACGILRLLADFSGLGNKMTVDVTGAGLGPSSR